MPASPTAPADAPAPAAAPSSTPYQHLLKMIMDALQVPRPTPEDEAACLTLVRYRSLAVGEACRRALAAPGEGGTLYAARYLYDAVSELPARYPLAPAAGPSGARGAAGGERVQA